MVDYFWRLVSYYSELRGEQRMVKERSLKYAISYAVRAAKDLHYSPLVIKKLKNAESEWDVDRIMATARKEEFERWDTYVHRKP